MIVGVDEVGRGPWAGPLVMAAVVLDGQIDGLTDSKKLSKKRREQLNEIIQNEAKAIGVGWVTADEIDKMGMSKALTECCLRALRQINAPFHEIIIDGTVNILKGTPLERYVTTLKKADLLIASVSAASIVAKVARDTYMREQDDVYPGYNFGSHSGYGTAMHRRALDEMGPCQLHRKSFAPIAVYYSKSPNKDPRHPHVLIETKRNRSAKNAVRNLESAPSTRSIGNKSEAEACDHLLRLGYEIIERNWKTKYCEIDIIAKKDDKLYFVEVKHRKTASSGDGMAAITPKKLNQMKFAAELYVHSKKVQPERSLMVISTSGEEPTIEKILEIL